MYNYVSNNGIAIHIENINEHIAKDDYQIYSMASNQAQYTEKMNKLYLKMFHGFLNNEKHLLDLFCNAWNNAEIEIAGLGYAAVSDQYKISISQAIEGVVSDFLVTTDLLQKMIDTKPELHDTVYKIDPGLFYMTSTSMLTKVDRTHQTVYFLVTTPLIKQEDIPPLYKVHNF